MKPLQERLKKDPVCPYCSKKLDHTETKVKYYTHHLKGPKSKDHKIRSVEELYHCDVCRIYISICNELLDYLKEEDKKNEKHIC